ncbi:hypothetical protein [Candidatus Enterovibrio escicola]|uniref:hypothetical protein n=1 Tax=Candidatus Enterovibrio escicola TaxID=1927127 RepID=UPI001237DF87|nr:hypothetical protein [Candidatus Enterovibrio escacola]
MTINLHNLQKLESELELYTQTHTKFSKIKVIRKLYHRIEKALDNGLTSQLICNFLTQKGLEISQNYLSLVLHRIRKERGNNPSSKNIHETRISASPSVISQDTSLENTASSSKENKSEDLKGKEKLRELLDRYYAVNGLSERYKALGGNVDDFIGKSISANRQLVNNLKTKITRQLRI